MVALPHELTAAALAVYAARQNKALGKIALAGAASHWALDLVPHIEPSSLSTLWHTDASSQLFVAIDLVLTGAVGLLLLWKFREYSIPLVVGVFCGCIPDIFSVGPKILGFKEFDGYLKVVNELHFQTTHGWWRSWFGEIPQWWGWLLGSATTVLVGILPATLYLSTVRVPDREPVWAPTLPGEP